MKNATPKTCVYCALAEHPGFRGFYYCRELDKSVKSQPNCCWFRPEEDIEESEETIWSDPDDHQNQ